MILTQQQLILTLRALPEPIRVCSLTVHAWVRAGCPTVPGWKKPRFILTNVLAWLAATKEVDPLTMEVRDKLYLRQLGRTG
jgi:hypothetical protein